MPIYEFWCQACGYEKDYTLSFVAVGSTDLSCPKCGAKMIKKISIPSAFIFNFPSIKTQDEMDSYARTRRGKK